MNRVSQPLPNVRMKECARDCTDCHRVTLETAGYCLHRGNSMTSGPPLALILNAGEICRTAAEFILTGSHFHTWTSGLAAEVCEKAAQECEVFSSDEKLAACAQACRKAARSCREIAAVMHR
jgi:hypothetical protein